MVEKNRPKLRLALVVSNIILNYSQNMLVKKRTVEMKSVSAGDFKTHCLSFINEVAQNRKPIIVTKYGKPIAKLVPFDTKKDIDSKPLRGSVTFLGDIISPVDEDWEANK